MNAKDAWTRLATGNARFAAGEQTTPRQTPEHRREIADYPTPFAGVLGCVDARVPPELVFDAGLGDLMSVRTAGPVLEPAVVASIELAVLRFELRLFVVLSHTVCGAVTETVGVVRDGKPVEGSMHSVIDAITPVVRSTPEAETRAASINAVAAANAHRIAERLPQVSKLIREAIDRPTDPLRVVPLNYDVESGLVSRIREPADETRIGN